MIFYKHSRKTVWETKPNRFYDQLQLLHFFFFPFNFSQHCLINRSFAFRTFFFSLIQLTQPFRSGRIWQMSIFKRSLTGLNSEFSFSKTSCLNKAEEISLSYYLPIAGGRIIGFIPFPRVLVLCEMQSVSSRIWTRVAVFISYDDNHYTISLMAVFLIT